jgi:SiaC family regulatory phosphoprotein
MERLNIPGTEETPQVAFDPSEPAYTISGRSLPEDVLTFFDPVMKWLDAFMISALPGMKLRVDLDYFNTASSKVLLDVFMKMEEAQEKGKDVGVVWVYGANDADMQDAGTEYAEIVSVPFEMVSK